MLVISNLSILRNRCGMEFSLRESVLLRVLKARLLSVSVCLLPFSSNPFFVSLFNAQCISFFLSMSSSRRPLSCVFAGEFVI